jgi:hypothetical protein
MVFKTEFFYMLIKHLPEKYYSILKYYDFVSKYPINIMILSQNF